MSKSKRPLLPIIIGVAIIVAVLAVIFIIPKSNSKVNSNVTTNNLDQNVIGKREDITIDPCAQFAKEFVGKAIGEPIIKTSKFDSDKSHVCQYFIEGNKMVQISIEYRNVEDQKKANEYLGWQVKKDESIGMDNFLVWQEGNVLNKLYLVVDPNTSIMLTRTAADVVDNNKMIALARAVASRIGGGSQTSNSVTASAKSAGSVPLPQEIDIIRSFLLIIGEHRPADAVSMMDQSLTGDDSSRQAWAVQFNAFESLEIKNIETSMPEDWTVDQHTYKVTIAAKMKAEAANAPIPYYGWENGINIRWVTIKKNGNLWKIAGIATGP